MKEVHLKRGRGRFLKNILQAHTKKRVLDLNCNFLVEILGMNSKDKYAPGLKKGRFLDLAMLGPNGKFGSFQHNNRSSLITISNVQPPVLFAYSPDGIHAGSPIFKRAILQFGEKQQERK